ncbi:MAG: queuosine salvage family protein [Candidatus Dormibacteraceae bacterium]
MEDPLGVRQGCAWVTGRARQVRLGPLDLALRSIADVPVPAWDRRHHYGGPPERTLRYLLVLDTINFSFWTAPGWAHQRRGYRETALALRRVFEQGDELATPQALREVTGDRLADLLGGPLPMLEERAAALRELGAHGFDGLVQETAAGTAQTLAASLAGYHDVATYEGRAIPILKRAQIAAADLWGAGVRAFPDLRSLTCFADYKLPQILRHWGALVLAPELAARVDARSPLLPGEPAEVEIRAATVTCVERLREELAAGGRDLPAVQVDWILWEGAQDLPEMLAHPRTRTVFY